MPKYVNWMIWFTSAVAALTDCYTGFVALTGGVSLVVNPWWFTLRVLAAIVMAASSWLSVWISRSRGAACISTTSTFSCVPVSRPWCW